ncbi:hypothetical protein Q5424_18175 [Conexibacter sp. JD483]|uniref:NHL domain-containing protein n=1 Tax=unclassified Conexibacter TaxID=2627773 RepID=UPI002717DC56|nr:MULTISPECIES: hypothetical protein [unclassified Conexibacter]MDO8184869.1 hypothetical protein [Conexibacter sp. CPCC 205706]MDO8196644.1 hypothetical protein [Conexibacter sp. CPCC 205762]MDR9371029.1 hypothetical protein [Conexibacter sp. JD483]
MNRRNRLQRILFALVVVLAASASAAGAADRIDTVAGSGTGGFAGDGGFAVRALLTSPSALAPFSGGEGYLIADTSNNRIRRVDPAGVITTVAGAGPCCGTSDPFAGNGVAATDASVRLNQPRGVAIAADGSVLIADSGNHRIRRVGAVAGVGPNAITTVAGNGIQGNGSNDNATTVSLNTPGDVAPLPDGGFLIADTGNNRIARVLPGGIRLITVAGGGGEGLGDGGPATSAELNAPARVVPLTGGGYLIADTGNNRIRRVGADGTITTVAGSGTVGGFSGDGGPATQAVLNGPEGVAVRDDGSIVIADSTNERIRLVTADGRISTIAGTATLGFSGDGGDPLAARLSHPRAVAASGTTLRIADSFNHRVRAITPVTPRANPPGTTQTPPRTVPPGVAPPVLATSTVVAPVSGTVLIRLKGRRGFVPLSSVANIPLGSELDANGGRVSLQFTTTAAGRRASAVVGGGRFVVNQDAAVERGQLPGNLLLSGPLEGCQAVRRGATARPRGHGASPATPRAQSSKKKKRARKGRKGRRVDVHADGVIRTQGRYGAAIVRGTRWTIVDRCPRDPHPGSYVTVRKGKVAVTAFALRRTVLVPAGRHFLAPVRRTRARRR